MVTLCTADLHVSANPRDAYRWVFLEETLPELIAEHKVERLLVLGDLTEAKDGHGAELVNQLVDALAALAELVPVHVLKGNHDYVAEDVPFYRFLRHLRRVRWINEPTALKLRGLGECLFLPHTRSTKDWIDANFDYDLYAWCFCHQTFSGANLGHGHKPEGGETALATFGKRARVISGDVHTPQKLGPVTYIGAPYRVDFGDEYDPRVLLLDGHKMRSIPVPGPQKRLVTVSGRDPLAALTMKPMRAGDVIKVKVELPAGSNAAHSDVRAQVRAWAEAAGVHLYTTQVVAPQPTRTKPVLNRQHASDHELVRAYAKKMRKGKAAVAVGLKLMEEVP